MEENKDNELINKEEEQQQTDAAETMEMSEVDKLTAELVEVRSKMAELNDSYMRLMADFDNYRKRTLKEKTDLIKTGGESALKNLLPVIDDFERAIKAMQSTEEVSPLLEGVELIYHKFIAYLGAQGVREIETCEAVFDTEYHEAITMIPAPCEELKGKIMDCVQKGYTLHDKVIRFAKVVVGE